MPRLTLRIGLLVALPAAILGCTPATSRAQAKPTSTPAASALAFTMKDLDGKNVRLSKYAGSVVLIVNVASKCGNTPQYAALQELYEKYRKRGFVVLGFPSNDFGAQEPGSAAEIRQFCSANYGVTFPMFAKIVVRGEGQAPLYRHLTSSDTNPLFAGEIEWNFAKFLIGRDGKVAARFAPRTAPDDPTIIEAIDAQLARRVRSQRPSTTKQGDEPGVQASHTNKTGRTQ